MTQFNVPLIPVPIPGSPTLLLVSGRLSGVAGASCALIPALPDGVFLEQLRIKGFWQSPDSVAVQFFRVAKDASVPAIESMVDSSFVGATTPGSLVTQTVALPFPDLRNVVDNGDFSYQISLVANTTGALSAIISEVAFFY